MSKRAINKVLVVDAEETFRRHVRGHLEHHGYYVECSDNAVDGIRLGLVFEPGVLITDWNLADDTDGVVLARALGRHIESLRVVFATAAPLDELRSRCADLDVSAFLAKPVSTSVLDEILAELLPTVTTA